MNKSAGGTAHDAPPKAKRSSTTSVADIALEDGAGMSGPTDNGFCGWFNYAGDLCPPHHTQPQCHTDPHARMLLPFGPQRLERLDTVSPAST